MISLIYIDEKKNPFSWGRRISPVKYWRCMQMWTCKMMSRALWKITWHSFRQIGRLFPFHHTLHGWGFCSRMGVGLLPNWAWMWMDIMLQKWHDGDSFHGILLFHSNQSKQSRITQWPIGIRVHNGAWSWLSVIAVSLLWRLFLMLREPLAADVVHDRVTWAFSCPHHVLY